MLRLKSFLALLLAALVLISCGIKPQSPQDQQSPPPQASDNGDVLISIAADGTWVGGTDQKRVLKTTDVTVEVSSKHAVHKSPPCVNEAITLMPQNPTPEAVTPPVLLHQRGQPDTCNDNNGSAAMKLPPATYVVARSNGESPGSKRLGTLTIVIKP